MKKTVCILTMLSCLSSTKTNACLNEYYTTIDGQSSEATYSMGVLYRSFDKVFSQKFVDHYDLNQKEKYEFEELSDVSIHLAKLGRYEESLELLLWLVERKPDEYQINANLGTLYELSGNVDSAYYYIEKSMVLNPESHLGTEWVHLAILKAKKKILQNPNWLQTHRVLDLKLDTPTDVDSDENEQILDTLNAIMYQMRERVPFTPAPDPILADIFDELGDWLAIHYSVEEAYIAYKIALEYGADQRFSTKQDLEEIASTISNNGAEVPDMDNHFPTADHFYKEPDRNLPNYSQPENETKPLLKEPEAKTSKLIWIILAGSFGLLVLALLIRKKSKNNQLTQR